MSGVFVACDVSVCLWEIHRNCCFLDADTDLPGIQEEVQQGLAEGTFLVRSHSSLEVPGMEGPNPELGILSPSELNLRTCVLACWSAVFVNNRNNEEIVVFNELILPFLLPYFASGWRVDSIATSNAKRNYHFCC